MSTAPANNEGATHMNTLTKQVAKYVRETDPQMFAQIARYVGSRSLVKVGEYVQDADPDMFDNIAVEVAA